jgi:hypothetical protein
MTTFTQDVRVGPDGTVTVAVGKHDAGRLVRVTVSPAANPTPMSREEWSAFIDRTAGQWVGEFPEIDDPPPTERDKL